MLHLFIYVQHSIKECDNLLQSDPISFVTIHDRTRLAEGFLSCGF